MAKHTISQWLKTHNKGDLHELSFYELKQCLNYVGHTCPVAEYILKGGK